MKKYRGAFIKNEREIECMARANNMVANILAAAGELIKPGVSTAQIEELACDMCADYGVKPAFKGYMDYPYATCCSVNEQVVHGFPNGRPMEEGDIISFDMGVEYKGFVGDAARTYAVGKVSEEARRLMRITEEALYKGIEQAVAGNDVYKIGEAVQNYVEAAGFNVVRRFVGHGVGARMHEKPEVPNFKPAMKGMPLHNGMVIAIEPMVTAGSPDVEILADKWTAVTRDRRLAAHYEHSIAITPEGPRILSIPDKGLNRQTWAS